MKKVTAKERLARYGTGGELKAKPISVISNDKSYDSIPSYLYYAKAIQEGNTEGAKKALGHITGIRGSDVATELQFMSKGLKKSSLNDLAKRGVSQTKNDQMKKFYSMINENPDIINQFQFALPKEQDIAVQPKMAIGGEVGIGLINSLGRPILDNLLGLLEGSNDYSTQPIVNTATMRAMSNPYSKMAMGGSVEDLTEEELAELQEQADLQGITVEELLEQQAALEEEDIYEDEEEYEEEYKEEEDEEDTSGMDLASQFSGEEYAMGGKIHIKKKNRGKFNALKKRTGKTTEQLTHSKNPLTRKRAIFAQNAKKWKHAMGGQVVEIEGDEITETPDGIIRKHTGPTHERGGIDINLPAGTKVYSDRLAVDGKTMQERKTEREKRLAKLNKIVTDNSNPFSKNTLKRTEEIYTKEEQQDMALQEVAGKIYGQPGEAAYGDVIDDKYMWNTYDSPYDPRIGQFDLSTEGIPINRTIGMNDMKLPQTSGLSIKSDLTNPSIPSKKDNGISLGAGDYVGLAGNLFNAIAPIVNTRNAAAATKPAVNRYLGFAKGALDANDSAQNYIQEQQTNANTDINTSANASYNRNRNSASSVNTIRALDAVTDMGKNKAKNTSANTFAQQMMQLLGNRGQIEMQKDRMEGYGQMQADAANEAILDNYFSNNAQNLVNLGNNIQGIGRSINKAKSNKVNARLISQLSQYGLDFDENGELISKSKK